MNCRIQVEHPVTEAVTGVDLVCEQLRIAAGEPLSIAQRAIRSTGHAIECRLTAEDPRDGFRPSPGTIARFSIAPRPGLRVDTHCEAGALVSPFYDSLLAKLIVRGEDRERAIGLMLEALDGTEVDGVRTNRELLRAAIGHPEFVAGPVDTGWLERLPHAIPA